MILRTELSLPQSEKKIKLDSKVITIGSCFSDVIGDFFIDNKIQCISNPFGVVYNISSIANIINSSIDLKNLEEEHFVETDNLYLHYDLHSSFKDASKIALNNAIIEKQKNLKSWIESADFMIITLGTSWVFELNQTKKIISNCQKQSADKFTKKLLDLETQTRIFEELISKLKSINPGLNIITTVSPVRHIKDNLVNNNLSKSILRLLCSDANCDYFPSFEIMNDDLRDYRFYKADLIHPTPLAEKYIIDKFSQTYFDSPLAAFIATFEKIKIAMAHKPFNVGTSSHQQFLKNTLLKLEELHAIKDLSKEISLIKSQIL